MFQRTILGKSSVKKKKLLIQHPVDSQASINYLTVTQQLFDEHSVNAYQKKSYGSVWGENSGRCECKWRIQSSFTKQWLDPKMQYGSPVHLCNCQSSYQEWSLFTSIHLRYCGVPFQTVAVKRMLQWSESHIFVCFLVHIQVLFTLYSRVLNLTHPGWRWEWGNPGPAQVSSTPMVRRRAVVAWDQAACSCTHVLMRNNISEAQ